MLRGQVHCQPHWCWQHLNQCVATVANVQATLAEWNRVTEMDVEFRFRPDKFYPSPSLLIVFTQIYLQVIFTILAVNQPIVTRESSSYYSYLFRYNYVTMFRIRVTQQIVEFSLSHREC